MANIYKVTEQVLFLMDKEYILEALLAKTENITDLDEDNPQLQIQAESDNFVAITVRKHWRSGGGASDKSSLYILHRPTSKYKFLKRVDYDRTLRWEVALTDSTMSATIKAKWAHFPSKDSGEPYKEDAGEWDVSLDDMELNGTKYNLDEGGPTEKTVLLAGTSNNPQIAKALGNALGDTYQVEFVPNEWYIGDRLDQGYPYYLTIFSPGGRDGRSRIEKEDCDRWADKATRLNYPTCVIDIKMKDGTEGKSIELKYPKETTAWVPETSLADKATWKEVLALIQDKVSEELEIAYQERL